MLALRRFSAPKLNIVPGDAIPDDRVAEENSIMDVEHVGESETRVPSTVHYSSRENKK